MVSGNYKKGTSMVKTVKGPYALEVAHRSEEAPEIGIEGIGTKGDVIAISGDTLILPEKKQSLYVTEKTLAEMGMDDITNKHYFTIAGSDSADITFNQVLETISQISPGLKFKPLQYLRQALGIELSEDTRKGLKEQMSMMSKSELHQRAFALALLNTLGFYHVQRRMNIDGSLAEGENVKIDRKKELETIAKEFFPDSHEIGEYLPRVFSRILKLKKETYSAESPRALAEKLKDKQAPGELEVPIEIAAILAHDKFGDKGASMLLENFKTRKLAATFQTEVNLDLYSQHDEIKKRVANANEFIDSYSSAEYFINDFATAKTIAENINNLRLITNLSYGSIILYDDKGVLAKLNRIKPVKTDSGTEYYLDGESISFEEQGKFYLGMKKVVDELEKLRKYGPLREIGSMAIAVDEQGNRVGFAKPFLIARHGFSEDAQLTEEQKLYLKGLESMIENEFEFSYKEKRREYVFSNPDTEEEMARISLPLDIKPEILNAMTFEDASSRLFSWKYELPPEVCEAFQAIYSKLPKEKTLSENEMVEYISLEDSKLLADMKKRRELRKRAGLDVDISPCGGKHFVVKRKLRSNGEYDTLGEIEIPEGVGYEEIFGSKPSDLLSQMPAEKRKLIHTLLNIKHGGIRYYENGGKQGRVIRIFREEHLDEFLDDFCTETGTDIEIKAVRITNSEYHDYFTKLLQLVIEGAKGENSELDGLRKKYKIPNDNHARMALETQRIFNREYLEMGLEMLAEIAGDRKIDLSEEIVYRILIDTLREKVPQQTVNFIMQRFEDAIEGKEEYNFPEEKELMDFIRAHVLEKGEKSVSGRSLERMCDIMIDITIPYHITDIKIQQQMLDFSSRFGNYLLSIGRRIDEASAEGQSKLYELMRNTTLAGDVKNRLDIVNEHFSIVKDASLLNNMITFGINEQEFARMLYAKEKLDKLNPKLFAEVLERAKNVHQDSESKHVLSQVNENLKDIELFRKEYKKGKRKESFEKYFYEQMKQIIGAVRAKYQQDKEDFGFEL